MKEEEEEKKWHKGTPDGNAMGAKMRSWRRVWNEDRMEGSSLQTEVVQKVPE